MTVSPVYFCLFCKHIKSNITSCWPVVQKSSGKWVQINQSTNKILVVKCKNTNVQIRWSLLKRHWSKRLKVFIKAGHYGNFKESTPLSNMLNSLYFYRKKPHLLNYIQSKDNYFFLLGFEIFVFEKKKPHCCSCDKEFTGIMLS